ncbi:mannose-1-phosphate guanylyltransferase/mannose-6-phosphate isomerase, partial [Arenibaculum sp.]|uniref:mannose-1-phosphate guanylyltransferase/mannose-6-phosphate isomerase n=1 Tax=Arenibaculum sp. TaxID=2865862 RepID=UPI002E118C82|nr:mannose-1-phosphate guanylyltransferase/mannose-6-phosphate isomerase [Arenibaculum sp.]
ADAVGKGSAAAGQGALVTFGIEPTGPNTGYGYIRRGAARPEDGVFAVDAFVEKPPADVAQAYVASGDYLWNGGMFLFRAETYLAELERYEPRVFEACAAALAKSRRDLDFLRLDEASFAASPNISVDYAVMERTADAAVVPLRAGWTDIGAWSALWEIGRQDADGNVAVGDVAFQEARNCYVRSDGMLTAVVGLDDAVVVAMKDAVLVTSRDRAQDVKRLVERLKTAGRAQTTDHHVVHRPWGSYETLHAGDRFQVKAISVKPGCKLSLQKHFHRSEHWVVVTGTAVVTRDGESLLLRENESVYLPLGCVHRLENPGKVALRLIEVQSGTYLGEDDIVRLDDSYGRQ